MASSLFTFNFTSVEILHDQSLGSGAYGSVFKAKCDKLPCAAKILHSSFLNMPDTMERFRQECDFLESIKHPRIVQFLGLYSDPKSNQKALIMELMDESLTAFLDRHNTIGNVPFRTQVNICHDIVLALHYLHTNEIIHRDLSSNNVLLTGGCIAKITDLGVSRIKDALQQQQLTQCPGSPVYMPPEALRSSPVYSDKLDSFSFGVLMIQIQTRRFPSPDSHELLIADASSPTGFVSMPVREVDRRENDISRIEDNPLKTVALSCIVDKPNDRPSSEALCDTMEELKGSQKYKDTPSAAPTATPTSEGTDNIGAVPIEESVTTDEGTDLVSELEKTLALKEKEIEELKQEVQLYQKQLEDREAIPINPPTLTNTPAPVQNLEESSVTTDEEETSSKNPEWNKARGNSRVVSKLNPDIVHLMSKSDLGAIAGTVYEVPGPGCITIVGNSRTPLNDVVKQVMLAYQKLANTPMQVLFVSIPENCPERELNGIINEYNSQYKHCSFSYIRDVSAFQIVSTNQTHLHKAAERLTKAMKFTIYFSDGRKLMLRKGDIVKQDVTVIVAATNKFMNPNGGMIKAVNIASNGKIEQYCKEHVAKCGPLGECNIATTPSGGGNLKCKWVIHALAPDVKQRSPSSCQNMMMMLIRRCLDEGNRLKASSIALPSIGTGHMNVRPKIAANGIITAVMDYAFEDEHSLRDIAIVVIDDQTFNVYCEVFKERMVDYYAQDMFAGDTLVPESPSDRESSGSYMSNTCKQQ